MKARTTSWATWSVNNNAIDITVDKEMLEMVSNQLRIEIVKAIEAHDDQKAVDLLEDKIGIDEKLKNYAERETEE